MVQVIEANWLAFALALAIGLIVAWWLFARGSKGVERTHRPDVLDEGVGPAQRNQALIDAPSAASRVHSPPPEAPPEVPMVVPPAMAGAMAGIGEVIGVAAQDEVEAAQAAQADAAASEPAGELDDLRRIKGVGPKLAGLLHSLGVTRFAQIAAWDDAEIDRIDAQLGTFAGRIRRDGWVEQAGYLASGDTAGFEARFGKL